MRTFSERLAESAQTPLTPQEHIDRLQALLDATADQNRFSLKPKDGAYEGSYNLKTNSGSYPMEDVVAMFDPLVTTPETERMIPSQQALREQTQAMKNWRATLDALQNADYTLDIEAKEKELQEANAKQYRDAMRQAMSNFLSRYVEPEKAELYDSSVGTTFSSLKNPYENFGYRTPLDHLSTYAQKKIAADALPVLIGGPTRTESERESGNPELQRILTELSRTTGVGRDSWSDKNPNPPPQDELQQILQYARDPTAPAREQVALNTANMYDVHPMHYDQFTQLVQGGMHPAMAAKQVSQGFDMSQPQFGDIQMSASPMDLAFRLLKERKTRQTTLSAFDERQIQENLKSQNSNIFIAAKPGNEKTRPEELSQLSDNMLAELAALKEKHGEFGITSATGNAAWDLEPSFMLTNVPQSARDEINAIAEKYRQQSIAVSEKGETGVKFVTPQGQITDEYSNMEMDPDAEYSTDFPTGQRLAFKSEPMDLVFRMLKERKSPEAMRHKLEYDKRYESSPERVKYREELNRERRRRGIMGSHDHMDVSHTQGNKLTLESEHDNRARHFKNRGTLRQIDKVE